MLVLARKLGESIVIGHDIRVTVVEVRGNKIRLGIEAPADVPVDRQEIRQLKLEFQEAAATVVAAT
jgi:carbon storage regulator